MSKKIKIALDVDGVLANFYLAICRHANIPYKTIDDWEDDEIYRIYEEIKDDPKFWSSLPILMPPEAITFEVAAYISSIPENVLESRIKWLQWNLYPDAPVISSYDKKVECKELGIDILVDDRPVTLIDLRDNSDTIPVKFTPSYMKDGDIYGIESISHLSEVSDIIKEMKNHE